MILQLERFAPGLDTVIGELCIDGVDFCSTLENVKHLIPAATYRVVLTESPRARKGELWCPGKDRKPPDFRLPLLLSVPGYDGIRIHAANTAADVKGCVGVGSWRGGEMLVGSRSALESLMDMLEIATISRRNIQIEIKDAT